VALIADGRFQEAIDLVREAIPFPGICGRICTHPCETDCRRNEVDQPLAIRQLKRFIADWELRNAGSAQTKASPTPSPINEGRRVAIVGAGPAGLTTAYFLVQQGHSVTVFEKLPVAGGMMAVGIPAFRLPRDILNMEINTIEKMGVEIKTGVTFGSDITLDGLKSNGFQAVFLATGLHGSRKLGVVGEDLPGVLDGVTFLRDVALGKQIILGHKVIVVGGGNVAIDVALTARRLGCDEVTIVCLETREEMPAWQFEIEEALGAGVEIVNCFGPNRFVEKNGRFSGIEFKRCTCVFDDHCNFNPQYDETDMNTLGAQTVIIAIGQTAARDSVEPKDIACSPRGEIIVDPVTLQTNISWVFAGGDAVYGPKSVVEAIASGKQAAASIHRYLSGQDLNSVRSRNGTDFKTGTAAANNYPTGKPAKQKPRDNSQMPISQQPLSDAQRLPKPRVPMPILPLEELLECFSEVELGYSEAQALIEARRCLMCGPCSECMACVESCKPLAINHEQQPMTVELDVGAVIYADDPRRFEKLPLALGEGIYRVRPEDLLLGSATAARVMSNWRAGSYSQPFTPALRSTGGSTRIGVFICRCGEAIAGTVDVEALRGQTTRLADVICVQILSFSCSPEACKTIAEMVSSLDLTHVVLAACACCSLDQVCYSCTYQRVRCKQILGFFDLPAFTPPPPAFAAAQNSWPIQIEFVNIREQCAWVHSNAPLAATKKAQSLITAAAAKLRLASPKSIESQANERSVMIAGSGEAAFVCRDHLQNRDIVVRQLDAQAARIWRTNGRYAIEQNGNTWTAESIVLAPQEPSEADGLLSAFGVDSHQPRIQSTWGGLETHLPGVFYCKPGADGLMIGAAAAARVSAWLGRCSGRVKPNTAVVDACRCRACQTCMDICEFGAPQLVGQEPDHNAWVDPNICTGCGTCAANCPSGAITAGYSSDEQLTAMIEAILADGERLDENR
jgi:NADPH-dependent glutamate synthase beta subunit-like oxidoreductase/Pyruvate/2-oxoacid:ferredoxin oxidoreductase delta subunit